MIFRILIRDVQQKVLPAGRLCLLRRISLYYIARLLYEISDRAFFVSADSADKSTKWRINHESRNGRKDDLFIPDFVKEAEEQIGKGVKLPTQEEVTIKFGKGLAEPFQSKDGREFMRITIPNQDPADKAPWASFVLPAKAVHENQYGKGLWAKIPADGTTVVTKPTLQGQDDKGKNIWKDAKTQVLNTELKAMVEAYKARTSQEKAAQPRESAMEKMDALVKDTAAKVSLDKPKKSKTKAKGPEL